MNTRLESVTIFRNNIIDNDLSGHATFVCASGDVKFKLSAKAIERISLVVDADVLGTMNELIDSAAVQTTNEPHKTGERSEQVQNSPTWDSFAEFRLKRQQAVFKNIEQPTK